MEFQPGQGALRLARTLLVAVPSVTVSTAAHSAAGGCITVTGLLLSGLVIGPSTWTQLSRERSTGFLVGWLALAQLLGHGLLELGCHGPQHDAASSPAHMLGLHVAAALLVAFLLSYGEHRVWAFARMLQAVSTRVQDIAGRLLQPMVAPPLPVVGRPTLAPTTTVAPILATWRAPCPVRRGPPHLALSRL